MSIQATWLSKLHEAQEKYQETLKSRYREGVEPLSEAVSGATSQVDTATMKSSEPVVPAHGDCRPGPSNLGSAVVAGAPSWLNAAGTNSSLIVPSFAVHDYGEQRVRASTHTYERLTVSHLLERCL